VELRRRKEKKKKRKMKTDDDALLFPPLFLRLACWTMMMPMMKKSWEAWRGLLSGLRSSELVLSRLRRRRKRKEVSDGGGGGGKAPKQTFFPSFRA